MMVKTRGTQAEAVTPTLRVMLANIDLKAENMYIV
jgi:hypothetical protein